MATDDIEGVSGRTVRMVVAKGVVWTAQPTLFIGDGPDRREVPNPGKFSFGIGEEIDLSLEDAEYLYQAGMVDRVGEPRNLPPIASLASPRIDSGAVGLVRSVTT